MAESFAYLLKRHRVAAGLSQEALAERARVSVDTISYLERDAQHAPQKATLDLLIAALALDDDSRHQIEEVAKLARARRPQAQRDEFRLNNLPPQLTSFVDREREMAVIKELLRSNRLVTVAGSGGVGKSRCAIRVAQSVLEGFVDGVWLAELAPISDPVLVSLVIARALSIQEAPNGPVVDTLLAYFKRKRLLLILDNCEHVIDEARRVVAAILSGCPDVRVLATSREGLNIAGEQMYRLPSLPFPSTSALPSADELSTYGAVQLFSDRAAAADNRFTITVESAPHVANICRRLDGIPLAIELAAARSNVLSPHELAQRLDERFRLFTARDRDALPRHRTMRALIDWSYDLLAPDERKLFRKLSIFAGGFTLKTAAAVCSEGEVDEVVVLDLLSSLVDKSLVQTEAVGDNTRYRFLESTRQYAREKLADTDEEETTAHAHAQAFLELAEHLNDAWETLPDSAWFAQVNPELENFRAALSWAFGTRGDVLLGQRLAAALRRVWDHSSAAEGRHWLQAARERVTVNTPAAILAELDIAEAAVALMLNQYNASLASANRALSRLRDLNNPRAIARLEAQIGWALAFLGNIGEGETLLKKALEAARSLGAQRTVIFALQGLGFACLSANDIPGARLRFGEALAAVHAAGAELFIATTIRVNLAEVEFQAGDASEALRLADESLSIRQAYADTRVRATAWANIAAYLVALRRYDEARTAARNAVTTAGETQWFVGVAITLQHFAAIAALRPNAHAPTIEEHRRAARMIGYVEERLAALESARGYTEQQEFDAILPVLRDELGADQFAQLMTEGAAWSEDQAVAEAMLI